MKKMKRREFARVAAGLALVGPTIVKAEDAASPSVGRGATTAVQNSQQAVAAEKKSYLTAAQEELLKQAIARREQQLAGMRARKLAYSAEPAFVFRAKAKGRG
ncbi:MAG: hypothetical protein HY046_08090 [Acidobacteria bacterium]|nr:hypothetical protein [Acidobacteriota bacterium]